MSQFKNIKAWQWILIVFAVTHFYGITHPPLDHHGFRQSDTMEVARSLVEEEFSLLRPRVAWRNDKSGITGSEFPIYNSILAVALSIRELLLTGGKGLNLGEQEPDNASVHKIISPGTYIAIGRILSLIFALIGLFSFYLIIKELHGEDIALYALFSLSCSMTWFYFSRCVQPDVPSVSMALLGMYLFIKYKTSSQRSTLYLLASSLSYMFAGLMKSPSLVLLFPLIYFAFFMPGYSKKFSFHYIWFSLIILLPLFSWMYYAKWLSQAEGLKYFFTGRPLKEALSQIFAYRFLSTLLKRFFQEYTGWVQAPFLLIGFWQLRHKTYKPLLYAFWAFGFFIFAIKAGEHITVHDYYGLPLVPALCAVSAFGIHWAVRKRAWVKYLLFAIVISVPIHLYGAYKMQCKYLIGAERQLHGLVPYNSRVMVDGGNWPVHLYMIHRKGWSQEPEMFYKRKYIEQVQKQGLEYLILFNQYDLKRLKAIYSDKKIVELKNFLVIKL